MSISSVNVFANMLRQTSQIDSASGRFRTASVSSSAEASNVETEKVTAAELDELQSHRLERFERHRNRLMSRFGLFEAKQEEVEAATPQNQEERLRTAIRSARVLNRIMNGMAYSQNRVDDTISETQQRGDQDFPAGRDGNFYDPSTLGSDLEDAKRLKDFSESLVRTLRDLEHEFRDLGEENPRLAEKLQSAISTADRMKVTTREYVSDLRFAAPPGASVSLVA